MRPYGGLIGANPTTASAGPNSAAGGIWTLRDAERLKRAGTWPLSSGDFVPTVLAGLQLWLDGSDSSTLYDATSGGSLVAADGAVARWEDKSGNARHATQGTSANRPARKTAIQASKDVLRFDGSNDFLTSTDFSDLSTGQAITALTVCKRSATGSVHTIISKTDGEASDITTEDGWGFRFLADNTLHLYASKDASSTNNTSSSTVTASAFTLLAFQATAGSLTTTTKLYKNGTILSLLTTGSVQALDGTAYPVRIGMEPNTGVNYNHFNGDIAEVIIYDSALSDVNRAAVESYLVTKWGIS